MFTVETNGYNKTVVRSAEPRESLRDSAAPARLPSDRRRRCGPPCRLRARRSKFLRGPCVKVVPHQVAHDRRARRHERCDRFVPTHSSALIDWWPMRYRRHREWFRGRFNAASWSKRRWRLSQLVSPQTLLRYNKSRADEWSLVDYRRGRNRPKGLEVIMPDANPHKH